MLKSLFGLRALFIVGSVLSLPAIGFAQVNRTWVSGVGDDVNPCSRTAPCKTFPGALLRTNIGGEIDALDSGGFGSVNISKSITIDGSGALSGTLATGTTGIIINITAAADTQKTVRLRKLSINGIGNGTTGINIIAANQIFLDDVLIDGFERGINLSAAGAFLSIRNSTVRKIVHVGINLEPGGNSPNAIVALEGCAISSTQVAVNASHGVQATIKDSSLLRSEIGVHAEDSNVTVINCLVAQGGRGIMSRGGAVVRISSSTITRNETGLAVTAGGRIISFKNNVVSGNQADGVPTSFLNPT